MVGVGTPLCHYMSLSNPINPVEKAIVQGLACDDSLQAIGQGLACDTMKKGCKQVPDHISELFRYGEQMWPRLSKLGSSKWYCTWCPRLIRGSHMSRFVTLATLSNGLRNR